MASYYTEKVRHLQEAQVKLIAQAIKLREANKRLKKKLKKEREKNRA